MQNVLLWTKIVQENEKRRVDFQEGRFFFHLMVSVTVGDTCGLTSTKHTHTHRNRWALLIPTTLTSFCHRTPRLLNQASAVDRMQMVFNQTRDNVHCGHSGECGLVAVR